MARARPRPSRRMFWPPLWHICSHERRHPRTRPDRGRAAPAQHPPSDRPDRRGRRISARVQRRAAASRLLMTGPRGVGKATLAWRIARFLLATPENDGGMFAPPPPDSLDIPDSHPDARRLSALSEPRLFLLRRPCVEKAARLKQDITVDEVRKMKSFFALSAADGGRRVAIIDAVDDMNTSAANALL